MSCNFREFELTLRADFEGRFRIAAVRKSIGHNLKIV